MDVKDADVVVEEEEGEQLLVGRDGHLHHLAVVADVEDHRELYAQALLLHHDQLEDLCKH